MKKQLNEIKRMQQLAGLLKENQGIVYSGNDLPDATDPDFHDDLYYALNKLGIYTRDQYMSDAPKEMELGSEEWMDLLSNITGKDTYGDELDDTDNKMAMLIQKALENMGFDVY
jgi:hypothetical protein